jgi:hypothetical protein
VVRRLGIEQISDSLSD